MTQARAECRAMVQEAQELRARVLADLTRRRRVLHSQIEQLRAGRERLAETIGDVRHAVDHITDELFRAEDEARLAAEAAGRQAAQGSSSDVTDHRRRLRRRTESGAPRPRRATDPTRGSRWKSSSPGSGPRPAPPATRRRPRPTSRRRTGSPSPARESHGGPGPRGRAPLRDPIETVRIVPASPAAEDPSRRRRRPPAIRAKTAADRVENPARIGLGCAGRGRAAPRPTPDRAAAAETDPTAPRTATPSWSSATRCSHPSWWRPGPSAQAGAAGRPERHPRPSAGQGRMGTRTCCSPRTTTPGATCDAVADQLMEAARAGATFAGGKADEAPGVDDVAGRWRRPSWPRCAGASRMPGPSVEDGDESALWSSSSARRSASGRAHASNGWPATRRSSPSRAPRWRRCPTARCCAGWSTTTGRSAPTVTTTRWPGPVPSGEDFPTGHVHPPAHAGCRCLLAPANT